MIKAGTTAKFEYSKGELRKLRENSNTFPSKHFNIVSTFFLGQYDVARRTKSNQRRNHVAHVNVEIYNVEQRRTNAVCFNVGLNNVKQRWKNNVIFNVDFHNVGQRRNNVANMIIWKNN